MLEQIKGDWWRGVLESDPVRPHIPIDFRLTDNRESYVLSENGVDADAAICIAYTNAPSKGINSEFWLFEDEIKYPNIAIVNKVNPSIKNLGKVINNWALDSFKVIEVLYLLNRLK